MAENWGQNEDMLRFYRAIDVKDSEERSSTMNRESPEANTTGPTQSLMSFF